MASEAPIAIVRDNTMEATAKEGVEFLEKVDPKLAKECKELQKNGTEVTNGAGDAPEANGKTEIKRDNTMVTTAEEGMDFLRRQGAESLIQLNGLDKMNPRVSPTKATKDQSSPLKRDRTMRETAEEGKKILEKAGGVNEDAKTRAQEKELNDSKSEDKEATKRPAEDKEEEEKPVDEKKAKVEEEKKPEEEAAPEQKSEETPAQ